MVAPAPVHQAIAADAWRVPRPFGAFAVRSDEAQHASQARAPYGQVHRVRADLFDAATLARLAALGLSRVSLSAFSDIDYAPTSLAELAAATSQAEERADQVDHADEADEAGHPDEIDLADRLAAALRLTGVLGPAPEACRHSVTRRIDFLACRGAGFHNDVARHWSRCLFWLLALDLTDVEFVIPHAGLRLVLAPGDLLVFDQTLAHGLCRPGDQGQALAASFEGPGSNDQIFLTGELLLNDAEWAALGAPWLALHEHEQRGALDLLVAQFDERTGTIQQLHSLQGGMRSSVCHVDTASVSDTELSPDTVSSPDTVQAPTGEARPQCAGAPTCCPD